MLGPTPYLEYNTALSACRLASLLLLPGCAEDSAHAVLLWLVSSCSHFEELLWAGHDFPRRVVSTVESRALAAGGIRAPAKLAALARTRLNIAYC